MHFHLEVITKLDRLDEEEFQAKFEAVYPDIPWSLGGRWRGAHSPGGPFPKDGVVRTDIGGVPFFHSAGVEGIRMITPFRLARPDDLLWLDSEAAQRYVDSDQAEPSSWIYIDGDEVRELTRDEVRELDGEGLAIATVDAKDGV